MARWIFEAQPQHHVDVGSRVDGFVAHVASFRDCEVFDVRPITTRIPGIGFKLADLMQPNDLLFAGGGIVIPFLACMPLSILDSVATATRLIRRVMS